MGNRRVSPETFYAVLGKAFGMSAEDARSIGDDVLGIFD